MNKSILVFAITAVAFVSWVGGAQAQTISFSSTRVPTSTIEPNLEIRGNTYIRGLNDVGQFVGGFGERNWTIWGTPHSFIYGSNDNGLQITGTGSESRSPEGYRLGWIQGDRYVNPNYRYLDLAPEQYPSAFNARVSQPNAINNSGIVVGRLSSDWLDRNPSQAYRYDSNTRALTMLSVPGAVSSEATDINASGQIVGNFRDASGFDHGFLYSGGTYTVIDMPGNVGSTRIGGINDAGTIVGSAYDYGNPNSFIYRGGVFTNFTADNRYTVASDINNAEQIVGWVGVSGERLGFLYQAGQSVILDLSTGTGSTYAYSINNGGQIGGAVDGLGFIATVSAVPEPSTWALWLVGLGLWGAMSLKTRTSPRR